MELQGIGFKAQIRREVPKTADNPSRCSSQVSFCSLVNQDLCADETTFTTGEDMPLSLEPINDDQCLVPTWGGICLQPFRAGEKLDGWLMNHIVHAIGHVCIRSPRSIHRRDDQQ